MSTESSARPRKAGAFDIRLIIALLIGVYGVVLMVMGIGFTTDDELREGRRGQHQPVGRHRHADVHGAVRPVGEAPAAGRAAEPETEDTAPAAGE